VFGWELDSAARKFYVLLVIVVLIVVSTNRLLQSRFGRAIMGTKDNEAAATMLGIPTSMTFLATFAWSGFVVGVGGAGYAALVQYLSPEAFGLEELILQFALIMV